MYSTADEVDSFELRLGEIVVDAVYFIILPFSHEIDQKSINNEMNGMSCRHFNSDFEFPLVSVLQTSSYTV